MSGWRTLSIESPMKLSVSDRQLILTDMASGKEAAVPLDEIARVVISTHSALMTARLMEQLSAANVCLILCDSRHNPACELLPLSRHDETAGCVLDRWPDEALMISLAKSAAKEGWSVRETEEKVKQALEKSELEKRQPKREKLSNDAKKAQDALRERLGTKVSLSGSDDSGRIVIEYFSKDELLNIYDTIMGKNSEEN